MDSSLGTALAWGATKVKLTVGISEVPPTHLIVLLNLNLTKQYSLVTKHQTKN